MGFFEDLPQRVRIGWLVGLAGLSLVSAGGRERRLVDAVQAGNHEDVRALLKGRADVNAPQADGTTALAWAVRADDHRPQPRRLDGGDGVGHLLRPGRDVRDHRAKGLYFRR